MKSVKFINIALVFAVFTLILLCGCRKRADENAMMTKLGYTNVVIEDILSNSTVFSHDNEQEIARITELLPLPIGRAYDSFSLQTDSINEISIVYTYDPDNVYAGGNGLNPFYETVSENNALLLFNSIGGLEKVNFDYYYYEDGGLNRMESYTLDGLTARFGEKTLSEEPDLYETLAGNIQIAEFYFAHYSRIYLGENPDEIVYRSGEPDEITALPNGFWVYLYKGLEQAFIMPEKPGGSAQILGDIDVYYFIDQLDSRLYATRGVSDFFPESYDDVILTLGKPSSERTIDGRKYISYLLRRDEPEEPDKYYYYIFEGGKMLESGLIYGEDYSVLNVD